MPPKVIECQEFDELSVRVGALLKNGEFRLDERIITKGYLTAAMQRGQIVLRATRFVGTFPLTPDLAVRVVPRATISNLSYMLARSGAISSAISGFARGYMPRFEFTESAEQTYAASLIDGVRTIARRGYMKEYLPPRHLASWRGRILPSDTVRKFTAKGIRHRHAFEQNVLTPSTVENIALKTSLKQVLGWLEANDRRNPLLQDARRLYQGMLHIDEWEGSRSDLVRQLSKRIHTLSPRLAHYRDALWTAYLLLQSALPDLTFDGFVRLDSLIVDVSKVFEAFLRRELAERLDEHGYEIQDGNEFPLPFFRDGDANIVQPDIVIRKGTKALAVLDAKYKPHPNAADRYEVLSFMDALALRRGGFVCPALENDTSRFLGTTASGKEMVLLRYDLAAEDPDAETDRFASNVLCMINGAHNYN